jgi:hypothetical protein
MKRTTKIQLDFDKNQLNTFLKKKEPIEHQW